MVKIRRRLCYLIFSISLSALILASQPAQAFPKGTGNKEKDRHVKLEGQANFRDVGGYKTKDGHTVKWGMIYRAGQLNKLTDADLVRLKELNIRTVVDLRGIAEAETRGKDRLPEGARGISYPIDVNSLPKDEKEDVVSDGSSAKNKDFMLQATRSIMIHATDAYGSLIRDLADSNNRPLVFHCSAGKDRAGVGTAIVLSLLGVPWKTVREDYLLSNFYRRDENEKGLKILQEEAAKQKGVPPGQVDITSLEGLYLVKPEYLDAAHDEVIRRYGSIESYLQKGLGISDAMIAKLKKDLLE